MKRHSTYTRKEAQAIVDQLISEGYELLGTREVNVDRFECPLPLESWSGETNAFELEKNGETTFIAYWTDVDPTLTHQDLHKLGGKILETTCEGCAELWLLDGIEYVVLADNSVITREEDNRMGSDAAFFPFTQ